MRKIPVSEIRKVITHLNRIINEPTLKIKKSDKEIPVRNVVAMLKCGMTTKEVQEETRLTKHQVAAVKAHITMGTY